MTAKLSPDSIGLMFTMHAAGHPVEHIADAAGCAYSTVVRYLNAAGIVLGNKGKPRQCTEQYLSMALDMRAHGSTWYDVEQPSASTVQRFRRGSGPRGLRHDHPPALLASNLNHPRRLSGSPCTPSQASRSAGSGRG